MTLKCACCGFILRVVLFSVVVKFNRQHPQIAAASEAQLKTDENLYQLNINLPDGSFRNETAKLQTSESSKEDLSVTGFMGINFIESNSMANSTYKADKNGFLVRYIYKQLKDPIYTLTTFRPTQPPPTSTEPPYASTELPFGFEGPLESLSPNVLKSSGG